jgi:hypothetical protein
MEAENEDAISKLLGVPPKSETLDAVRMDIWQKFEAMEAHFDQYEDTELPALVRGLALSVTALNAIVSVVINKPESYFSYLYPVDEMVAVIREELERKVSGSPEN